MFIFPNNFIENLLSIKILKCVLQIMGNKGEEYPYKWLIELIENERFVDLGDIKSSQHWIKRAYHNDYDADGNYYSSLAAGKVTKLENEELKQFISITGGTFGLIKF
jgi:hypothetical protein